MEGGVEKNLETDERGVQGKKSEANAGSAYGGSPRR